MQEQRNRLMALLATEQAARAALEQRLLPAPTRTPPASRVGLWTLAILLLAALALAGWHFRESILATPVSYTHLDVYKRQVKVTAQPTTTKRPPA